MKKYTSKEAYFHRMKDLAIVDKTSVNESKNRNLGTLIDFERAANGIAYGIIKENHKYYIKKGGLNKNQTVADFAYIGGLGNITNFEYNRLGEAEKNRNFLLQTLNEGLQPIKKKKTKRSFLTEDKASKEIGDAESKLGDLEVATDAAEVPAEPVPEVPAEDNGAAEMAAGVKNMPPEGGEEGLPPEGGEEGLPPEGGEEGLPPEGGEESKDEATREIEKSLGKITNTLRKTELTDSQVKSYVNSFLSAFKDKFPDIDIEDRKEMAEKITKVVPPEDIEDLGTNVEKTEEIPLEPEEKMTENGFAQYVESRGYNAESIQECGNEEMANLVSGYANGFNGGENDGDFKAVALFITPEIIEKLKGDYGHNDYADQLTPYTNELSECSASDRATQITELFGGLGHLAKKAGQGIKQGAQNLGQNIAQKAGQVQQAVGNAATNIKQTYHAGEKNAALGKLEKVASDLGKQIAAVNNQATKAGQEPINVQSILTTIKNQVGGTGSADLSKFRTTEELDDVAKTEVQPPLEEKAVEEDVKFTVSEKQGKKLSPNNTPEVEMKESEEKESENIDIDNLDVSDEETSNNEPNISAGFEPMGGGVIKPDGAETTTVEVTKGAVNVTMNEAIQKMNEALEEISKELNETKPSAGLSKEKKSAVVKKAKAGGDIGKKGKKFKDVEAKAKKGGAKNPKAVAAAAMWKNIKEGKEVKEGNAFTAGLAKTPKGGEFKVNDKEVKDTSNYDKSLDEKWSKDVDVKKTGEYAGKSIETLHKELESLKKKSKIYQDKNEKVPEDIKKKEHQVEFALRAKGGWKKNMSESEIKLRKYIHNRLEEYTGLKKPSLNEAKKSKTLKKLDNTIKKQFELYESTINEGFGEKIGNTLGRMNQRIEGRLRKQKELKQLLTTISPNDDIGLNRALENAFGSDQYSAGVKQYIPRTDAAKKFEIAQQAANDPKGLGVLKFDNGSLVYQSVDYNRPTKSTTDFSTGRSRLGEEK